jgi:hypothetical protein
MIVGEEVDTLIKVPGLFDEFIDQSIVKDLSVVFVSHSTAQLSRLDIEVLADEVNGVGRELDCEHRFGLLELRLLSQLFQLFQSTPFQVVRRDLVADFVQHLYQRNKLLVRVRLHFLLPQFFVFKQVYQLTLVPQPS